MKVTREEAPMNCEADGELVGRVPLETGTVAMVVAAGTPAGVVSAPAGAAVGVPTTRAAEAVVLPVTVWKMT